MLALGLLLVGSPRVLALDPALDLNQYAHTAWSFRDGFSKGRVTSFAQTPDGYLWLGTEFGLLRFDGVRTVPWRPPGDEQLPANWVRALLTAPDGTLWIGTFRGLASLKNGTLTRYAELAGHDVYALLVDHQGTVWIGGGLTGVGGTLCTIQRGRMQCLGDGSGLGGWVASFHEDRDHNIWVASQTGLWRWKPGLPTRYPFPVVGTSQALAASDQSTLLIATPDGISQLVDGKGSPYRLPGSAPRFKPQRMLVDRDGGLWIGTLDRGLLHVHQGRTDLFTQANGLSGNSVTKLFEDREGNIWVATMDGVDRFRDVAVRTMSANQGLSSGSPWSVLASRDGSVWLGSNGGLSRWHDGQVTIYRARSHPGLPDDAVGTLFEDHRQRIWVSTLRGIAYFEDGRFVPVPRLPPGHTHSMVGDTAGNLWLINDVQGLFHVRDGRIVDQVPWGTLGLKGAASALLVDAKEGGVWIGFEGRVALFKNGRIDASYVIADGVVENRVNNLRLDRDGALWAASERGLSRVKDGHVVTLASQNGLPCDAVYWSMEDDDQAVWMYTACGVVRIAATELNAGISDPKRRLQTAVFDGSSGVGLRGNTPAYDPQVAKSTDGRLWFLPNDGVSVLDPRRLSINPLPPPVHVEQVTANGQTYDVSSEVRLPPLIRDLRIDYTALSFVAPEKNRFRIKLEGWDADWLDVENRRQVLYSNLPPGQYHFKVTASNNSGVWNETGARLDLYIAPAYYQTAWFRVSAVAAGAALLWCAYWVRVRGIQQRADQLGSINAELEAQIAERKQAEVALRQAQGDLAHANRVSSMGELSASLAHEVTQPIAAAITDANTCLRWLSREQPDVEEARAAASRVVQDGKRAGDIVARVRLLFKKGTLQREAVDVNEIIREMALLLHGEAAQHAVSIRTVLAADLPAVIGDRVQLQQVLMNLMMNSVDAMKDMEGARELTLQSQVGEEGRVLISVSDTGVGLPPDQADRVFDAFFTTKSHGTGMGLRISRSIVEAHHGRLWASANSPRGARFCFTLPTEG
jgi:signal transduction histidine kinase/ligand-binding sensor domain-containing protein